MVFQLARTPIGSEQAGEDYEPEREAIDSYVVADGGVRDPGDVLNELEAGRR